LEDYPVVDEGRLNDEILINMDRVRDICSIGLKIRDDNRLKVRQPLSKVYVPISDLQMQEIIKGELNVKEVVFSEKEQTGDGLISQSDGKVFVSLDINLTNELKEEGMLNEIIRGLQVARKESGCEVGERVSILYMTDSSEIESIITTYEEKLKSNVIIDLFEKRDTLENGIQIKVEDKEVMVEIKK